MAYLQWLAVTCSSVQSSTSQVHIAPDLLQAILGTLEVEDMPTAQLDGWSCLNLLTADLAVISPNQWLLLPCAAACRRVGRAPLKKQSTWVLPLAAAHAIRLSMRPIEPCNWRKRTGAQLKVSSGGCSQQ